MKTGILFDLDGTLLDTLEDLKDATNAALEHFGCPLRTLAEIRSFVGNGARNQIRLSLPGAANDPDLDTVLTWYNEYYSAHCQIKKAPYEGILEALADLQRDFPVAIVSYKPDVAVKTLSAQYFPGVYALGESADCPRKPAPDMVFQAMAALGTERCVYIGDSDVDILTAKNAGVPCLSVTWGFRNQTELLEAGAAYFCHDPAELLQCIENVLHR